MIVHTLYSEIIGTSPSFEKKKALPKLWQQNGKITNVLNNCISTSVATICVCVRVCVCVCVNNSLAFGDEFLAQGLHLKSAGIRTWLSADQSISSTLTESSSLFDPCLIHRDTVMLE